MEDIEYKEFLAPDEVEVELKAVGIDFKDVLIVLGQIPEDGFGNECAGEVTRTGSEVDLKPGDRVSVFALNTYKTYVRTKAINVMKIPKSVSYPEAAALPVIYLTAYHALYDHARLVKGESVLIHSGAGGVGQAAIQLCKLLEADIYVTVGTEKKKRLLQDLYAIPEDHILSSRGMSFTQGIKRMTKGCGIDVILNSLAGDSLRGSWDCLAPFGRFVEIGKKDILGGSKLSMFPISKNRKFSAINLTHLSAERPALLRETMKEVMALVGSGKIGPPQPLHIYENSRVEEAFRYLQGGKNTGKAILEINKEHLALVSWCLMRRGLLLC